MSHHPPHRQTTQQPFHGWPLRFAIPAATNLAPGEVVFGLWPGARPNSRACVGARGGQRTGSRASLGVFCSPFRMRGSTSRQVSTRPSKRSSDLRSLLPAATIKARSISTSGLLGRELCWCHVQPRWSQHQKAFCYACAARRGGPHRWSSTTDWIDRVGSCVVARLFRPGRTFPYGDADRERTPAIGQRRIPCAGRHRPSEVKRVADMRTRLEELLAVTEQDHAGTLIVGERLRRIVLQPPT